MPGEAGGPHALMMGGYEGGYQAVSGYHGGYEDGRHGVQWPGYHHHHGATGPHSQGSPTQRYPYYDTR